MLRLRRTHQAPHRSTRQIRYRLPCPSSNSPTRHHRKPTPIKPLLGKPALQQTQHIPHTHPHSTGNTTCSLAGNVCNRSIGRLTTSLPRNPAPTGWRAEQKRHIRHRTTLPIERPDKRREIRVNPRRPCQRTQRVRRHRIHLTHQHPSTGGERHPVRTSRHRHPIHAEQRVSLTTDSPTKPPRGHLPQDQRTHRNDQPAPLIGRDQRHRTVTRGR
jgi:hypothetical protein